MASEPDLSPEHIMAVLAQMDEHLDDPIGILTFHPILPNPDFAVEQAAIRARLGL